MSGAALLDEPKILVVDDEATQRLLTRSHLEDEGFTVVEASSGEEALEAIHRLQPNLILLDVMMPGIDGFEVCRRIRADPSVCHIPIIIVTGREDAEDVQKGFAAGATDFLTKPLIWNLLPSRVRYVLRTSTLEQELRAAKLVAEKASEAKSTLLSTMGHELRTPLNAIIGFSAMMKQAAFGPIGSPTYEEFVVDIHASGMRLLNAINAILEIVNCESGQLELEQAEIDLVDLVDLVTSAIQQVTQEAGASGVQIVNDVSEAGVCILGDQPRLTQILFNLVSNSVRFTETGGVVRLYSSRSEQGDLVLTVADNGIGILADDLTRIMEPFEQSDNKLTRQYEGLGLGIPLAVAMTRLHGGTIEFESELGKGTSARITIPADRVLTSGKSAAITRTANMAPG